MQRQLFNMKFNTLIVYHVSISIVVNGFSILLYSLLAALEICDILTGKPSSAAINAAFSAIFLMLPPGILSFASFSISRLPVGAADGKARRHISVRCTVSGKGNCITNRMRLIHALSSAVFILVVSIANPR